MTHNIKVAAVVVTYNRLDLLKECIAALSRQKLSDERRGITITLDMLVVDNCSTDDTANTLRELAEEMPALNPEYLTENLGGAGGFSYGMKQAVEAGYDYVWIMDDDTIPNDNALLKFVQTAKELNQEEEQNSAFGYLSSKVFWTDGSLCKMNQQHMLPCDNSRLKKLEFKGIRPIDQASFVSLFFPRSVIEEVGLPIKEYFIWGDDKEYTLRIAQKYPCYLVDASSVVHKMTINAGSNITYDQAQKISRYYYAYRNDYVTARGRGKREVAVYYMAFLLNSLRIILYSSDHKKERLAIMRKGLQDGKKFAPEIEYVKY